MKKIFFPILVSFLGLTVQAQQKTSHVELSVNGGIASPTGNFSKSDYEDESSGFAKSGGHFNITGTYFLSKHFGIGALVGFSQFGFKGAQSLADGYKEDSGTDSTTLYTKGKNQDFSVLAGPYYRFTLGKSLSLDLRVLAGYVKTNLAGFSVYYEDYTDNVMSQKEASGGGFGYQAGAGLNYHISNCWGVKINADYFSSKPKVDIAYENFVVNSGRRLSTYNESLSGIAATVGLFYSF